MHYRHRCQAHKDAPHPLLTSLVCEDIKLEDEKCRTLSLQTWVSFPPKFIPFTHSDTHLGKPFKLMKFNRCPALPMPPLTQVTEGLVYMVCDSTTACSNA